MEPGTAAELPLQDHTPQWHSADTCVRREFVIGSEAVTVNPSNANPEHDLSAVRAALVLCSTAWFYAAAQETSIQI